MKKYLILLFALLSFAIFAQNSKDTNLLTFFAKKDTIITTPSIKMELGKGELPIKIILKYLCNVKNECEFNFNNGREYHYYPLSQKEFKTFYLLSYVVTDTYEFKVYLINIDKKNCEKGLQLLVFDNMSTDTKVNSIIEKNKIIIFRTQNVECKNYDLKKPDKKCYKTFKNVYQLNKNFTSLDKKNILPDIITND